MQPVRKPRLTYFIYSETLVANEAVVCLLAHIGENRSPRLRSAQTATACTAAGEAIVEA